MKVQIRITDILTFYESLVKQLRSENDFLRKIVLSAENSSKDEISFLRHELNQKNRLIEMILEKPGKINTNGTTIGSPVITSQENNHQPEIVKASTGKTINKSTNQKINAIRN